MNSIVVFKIISKDLITFVLSGSIINHVIVYSKSKISILKLNPDFNIKSRFQYYISNSKLNLDFIMKSQFVIKSQIQSSITISILSLEFKVKSRFQYQVQFESKILIS